MRDFCRNGRIRFKPTMPIFQLDDRLIFPSPEFAEDDGLLAVGGDLSANRLILAYSMGIFPWFSDDSQILWWSPDPRLVLFPSNLRVSRSLKQVMKKARYRITTDMAFEDVVRGCAESPRSRGAGTWITHGMKLAYQVLHEQGVAHSVEAWHGEVLVGGLYGVALGGVFFGESMFSVMDDASKVAFARLVKYLSWRKFSLIDCQVTSQHLMALGASEISRSEFI
ncbi:MAG: leucyl/phenylalanyl-tRNA--protein transferase, partial [Thermodesulfovibrionales bacterium]